MKGRGHVDIWSRGDVLQYMLDQLRRGEVKSCSLLRVQKGPRSPLKKHFALWVLQQPRVFSRPHQEHCFGSMSLVAMAAWLSLAYSGLADTNLTPVSVILLCRYRN